jgi:hypothetical protein
MACTTCHDKHSTFDFVNDGHDYALRFMKPTKLVIDPAVTIDFNGSSNNCVTCHQPRNSYPVPTGTADVTITSSRYGPHHGPQSTILQGIMGANIPGSTGYPGVGTAKHRTGASCTSCHMAAPIAGDVTKGSHTWKLTDGNCASCHGTSFPTTVTGFAADYATLGNLLIAKGYINSSGSVLGPNGSSASTTNALVVPVKHAQAIWNYKTLLEDQSMGIHNPPYTKALLKNSIEALQ